MTISSIPTLEADIECSIHSLAILVREYPALLKATLSIPQRMPDYNQLISVGVPVELLRRRPDVTQAEYTLAAAAAACGVAKKDFLPVLSIDGSIGFQGHKVNEWFKGDAFNYSLELKLTWTVFNGLARKYAVMSAKDKTMMEGDN